MVIRFDRTKCDALRATVILQKNIKINFFQEISSNHSVCEPLNHRHCEVLPSGNTPNGILSDGASSGASIPLDRTIKCWFSFY